MKYILPLIFGLFFTQCGVHYVSLLGSHKSPVEEIRIQEGFGVKLEAVQRRVVGYISLTPEGDERQLKANQIFLSAVIEKVVMDNKFKEDPNSDYKLKFISYIPDESNSPLGSILWIFTLGIVPMWSNKNYPLELEVYYKEELLKKYNYGYRNFGLLGWVPIPINILITPFVKNMTSEFGLVPGTPYILNRLKPMIDKVGYDAVNDFNIEPNLVMENNADTTSKVEIFRGNVSSITGELVTVTFKKKEGIRKGLLVFYRDTTGKILTTGKIQEVGTSSAKANFKGEIPKKGLEVVGYKEIY